MINAHRQLLKDAQGALAKSQSIMLHEQYYKLASELESIMVRIGQVLLVETDNSHTCTCSHADDQLELPLVYPNTEQTKK